MAGGAAAPVRSAALRFLRRMNFHLVKYLHLVTVAASFALFFIRGVWVLRAYPRPEEQWVRLLPHAIDTLVLVSGVALIALAWEGRWPEEWLIWKLVFVLLYAVLMVIVLRLAKQRWQKALAWVAAMLMFLFVATVAVLHHKFGILSLL